MDVKADHLVRYLVAVGCTAAVTFALYALGSSVIGLCLASFVGGAVASMALRENRLWPGSD